jgi:hypothetical protein
MKAVNLTGLVLVHVLSRSWSGRVKVSRDLDLAKAKADLPPQDILTDGQKCLVAPKVLTHFNTMYNQMKRVFSRKGFAFLGGYAIKEADAAALFAEADAIRDRYAAAADDFVLELERHYDEHETANPAWAHILRPARRAPSWVRSRFSLGYLPFKPGPVSQDPKDPLNASFHTHASRAMYALLEDVARDSRELIKDSFIDKSTASAKDRVTQKALRPVRELIAKLDAFSFMDTQIYPAVQALEASIDQLPRTGPLSTSDVLRVLALLETLSDPEDVLALKPGAATTQTALPLASAASPAAAVPQPVAAPAAAVVPDPDPDAVEPAPPHPAAIPVSPARNLPAELFDSRW